jgi:hypothetical protein
MPRLGFDPTTPVFGRKKSVHALNSAATVIGINGMRQMYISMVVLRFLTLQLQRIWEQS